MNVFIKNLNSKQKQAVEFGEGPLLIIAGAGTGKTTVVTERIKHLIVSGRAKPLEILALTFTEKASREMEERVEMALPYGIPQMWISTFHSFCDRILRSESLNIGLDPGYRLMTEAETILFFKRYLFRFDLDYFRPLGNPTKFIKGMLQHFSRLKDEDVEPDQYFDWVKDLNSDKEEISKYQELANAYRTFEELKVKDGVADFSDLIINTLKVFRLRKSVLKRYQDQFKYILIDEFQDTNFAQNEMAVLLSGVRKNITVVADDDQAIYRWRGAAVSNVIQFRKRFPKVHIISLTQNYRSTQTILDRSYQLIQNNNPDRLEVAHNIDKKLTSVRGEKGREAEFLFAGRVENEADSVVKIIRDLKQSDNKYQWSDFAILVRANSHADPFLRALGRLGIPYQFLGPGQLFKQPEIKDLISYLKFLYDIGDNVALYRVLSMDVFEVSARVIAAIVSYSKNNNISLFETLESADKLNLEKENLLKIEFFVKMVHRHLGLIKKDTAGQILYYFLQDSGLLASLTSYKTVRGEKIASNIAKFFDKIKSYEIDHEDSGVFAVVDWIDLAMSLGESPLASDSDWTENDAVNILTIHSSKGLEFPVVFLVNLVGARFPTTEKKEQIPIPDELIKEILPVGDSHILEERRLFYVGLTRARDRLFLTAAKYYGEGKREKKISPFIIETLGEDIVQRVLDKPYRDEKQLALLSEWEIKESSNDDLPVRPPVNFLSHSQLETFNTCPLQYKYRYILKIPAPPSAALTFGDTMHKSIKTFYELIKSGQKPALDLLLQSLNDNWSSMGFGTKEYENKMKNHGIKLLKEFYEKGYSPDMIPGDMEISFKVRINPHLVLGGKIDRIDNLPDGKIEIIDYKTGKAPKERNPGNDPQLTVYALAACDPGIYGKRPEDVIVSFYFFEGNQKVSGTRTKDQLDEAKNDMAERAREIQISDMSPKPGKICDFCEYRLLCEAWI